MKRIFILLLLALMVCALPAQNRIFVAYGGNDSNNGATWETAKLTLAAALNGATPGTTIYMKAAEYLTYDITIPAGVTVIGGFNTNSAGTDTTQRQYPGVHSTWENTANSTILDAESYGRIATVQGRLENCVIRNGYVVGNGAGVYIDGGTVSHCVLIRNYATTTAGDTTKGKGGGAYLTNGGRLINCVLSYNRAKEGLAVAGNDGELINNTISNNSAIVDCGTVTDIDNYTYRTVVIGTQCWMRDNMRAKHYPDGTEIPSNYYVCPNNDATNTAEYGLLYARVTFNNSVNGIIYRSGPCPTGWHMPTRAEVQTLIDYVNRTPQYRYNGNNNSIAKALAATEGWMNYSSSAMPGFNQVGNNATGFNAMPAGFGNTYFGQYFYLWTNSNYNSSSTVYYYIQYGTQTISWNAGTSNSSIRCLKDN